MFDTRPDPLLRERCRILLLAHGTSPRVSYVGRVAPRVISVDPSRQHPRDVLWDEAVAKTRRELAFARAGGGS